MDVLKERAHICVVRGRISLMRGLTTTRSGSLHMRSRERWHAILGGITAITIITAACASVSIHQVLADPANYRDRDVTVRGHVTEAASLLGKGAYQLSDGGESIWVVSSSGTPRKGERVDATGRVREGFDLGGLGLKLPGALGGGVVLVESSHRVHD